MIDILGLDRAGVLALDPTAVNWRITPGEFIHIATKLGAYWQYNYEAAKAGRLGQHALLKSGLHSDGFFVSKILLEPLNIRQLMALQMVRRFAATPGYPWPTHVAGIPAGATLLGENVAQVMNLPHLEMKKDTDGHIVLVDEIPAGAILMLPEDFSTRGTGFAEAVRMVMQSPLRDPSAQILHVDPVLLNRGGIKQVHVDGYGDYPVLPLVERHISDWDPTVHCPLCAMGSTAIKPKVDDETWERFIHSQD